MQILKFISYIIVIFLILGIVTSYMIQNKFISNELVNKDVSEKPTIVCSIDPIYDIVKQIVGDKANVKLIISSGIDPHTYQPTKKDRDILLAADLVIFNGLGLEHLSYYKKLINKNMLILLGDEIKNRFEKSILYIDETPDPHIWLNISLWAQSIYVILDSIVDLLPNEGNYLLEKAGILYSNLNNEHNIIKNKFSTLSEDKKYLITAHTAFNYFVKEYLFSTIEYNQGKNREYDKTWKSIYIAPEGLSPDSEVTMNQIMNVVNFAIENKVNIMFKEYGVREDILSKIEHILKSMSHDISISQFELYGDSFISSEEFKENSSYLFFMNKNAKTIFDGLSKQ